MEVLSSDEEIKKLKQKVKDLEWKLESANLEKDLQNATESAMRESLLQLLQKTQVERDLALSEVNKLNGELKLARKIIDNPPCEYIDCKYLTEDKSLWCCKCSGDLERYNENESNKKSA